jgi:transposase
LTDGVVVEYLRVGFSDGNPTYGEGRSHFLPPQSPQMNRIEEEWLHLKRHELSAQLFEDEYDLASALIQAIAERAQRQGYLVERFEFNSG